MIFGIYLFITVFLIDNDLVASSFDFRTPEDELMYVTEILKLPKSVNPIIFGNIDRVPADSKSTIFSFYRHCTSTESNKQLIRQLEWKVVLGIFEWKSSEGKEPTKLDAELQKSIQQCLENFRSHTTEESAADNKNTGSGTAEALETKSNTRINNTGTSTVGTNTNQIGSTGTGPSSQIFVSQSIGDIDVRCPKDDSPSLSDHGNKEKFLILIQETRGLPKAACGRVILIDYALRFIRRSALSIYGEFVRNIERQTLNVIQEYRSKQGSERVAELLKDLRNIFLHYTNWYEKFFSDRVHDSPLRINRLMYSPNPHNPNFPAKETLLKSIPEADHFSYDANWKILMIILNFPISINPVVVGNIYLIPVSVLEKFIESIEFCQQIFSYSSTVQCMKIVEDTIISVILRWKTILNNLSKDLPPSLKVENNLKEKTRPDFTKIGDLIVCPNKSRISDKKDKLRNLSEDLNLSPGELVEVIASLPAETCGWVFVFAWMVKKISDANKNKEMDNHVVQILRQFSNNPEEDKKLLITLMKYFNEVTLFFETLHNGEMDTKKKEVIEQSTEKILSESMSRVKIEDIQTEPGRSKDPSNLVTGTSSSNMNQKSGTPTDSSELSFDYGSFPFIPKVETGETENDEVRDVGPNDDSENEGYNREIDQILNVDELNLVLTLE